MWTARLLAALLTLAALPARALPLAEELELRRQESSLLHHRLDLTRLLRWQPEAQRWSPAAPTPAALLLVHLWAVECGPCIAEMPQLGKLLQPLRGQRDVRAVLISETLSDRALFEFMRAQGAQLPPHVEHYRVTDGRLRAALQNRMQPLTLLVDRHLVVRHAFVGSLLERRSELVTALERLTAQVRAR